MEFFSNFFFPPWEGGGEKYLEELMYGLPYRTAISIRRKGKNNPRRGKVSLPPAENPTIPVKQSLNHLFHSIALSPLESRHLKEFLIEILFLNAHIRSCKRFCQVVIQSVGRFCSRQCVEVNFPFLRSYPPSPPPHVGL